MHLCVLCGSQKKKQWFFFSTQQWLIGFYNRDRECLLRGTNWAFKSDRYSFVLKRLMYNLSEPFSCTLDPRFSRWLGSNTPHEKRNMGNTHTHTHTHTHIYIFAKTLLYKLILFSPIISLTIMRCGSKACSSCRTTVMLLPSAQRASDVTCHSCGDRRDLSKPRDTNPRNARYYCT